MLERSRKWKQREDNAKRLNEGKKEKKSKGKKEITI